MNQYFIVGEKFRPQECRDLLESLPDGEPLLLVREPGNKHDANAIRVHARGMHIGYVRGSQAEALAPLIDRAGADMALDGVGPAKTVAARFHRTPNHKVPALSLDPIE